MVPILREEFTLITYDLRGHGASPTSDAAFDLDDLVRDLERVRETTGFERAHFAGHSLGGMIAPAYALQFPDRVLSLALLSTAAGRTEEDSRKVWTVVHAMEQTSIAEVLDTLVDRWFTEPFVDSQSDIVQRRLQQVVDTDPEVFLNVFRIYAGTEMMPWLHRVNAPSLVLTGENDGGCSPRLNALINSALPNSELVILPQVKHAILLEAPDQVATNLIRFIKENEWNR